MFESRVPTSGGGESGIGGGGTGESDQWEYGAVPDPGTSTGSTGTQPIRVPVDGTGTDLYQYA